MIKALSAGCFVGSCAGCLVGSCTLLFTGLYSVFRFEKMISPTWRRETEVVHPEVWRKFEKTNKDGKKIKFRVQTASEEYYDDMIEMLNKDFFPDETNSSSAGAHESPEFLAFINREVKRVMFPQQVCVICVIDDDSAKGKLVGFNMIGVDNVDEVMDLSELMTFDVGLKVLSIWMELKKQLPNIHELYKEDKYLASLALCVAPGFRGMSIAEEILRGRIDITKAIGLKVTSSSFSSPASQRVASKAGFVEDGSYPYADLIKAVGFPMNNKCETVKSQTYKHD